MTDQSFFSSRKSRQSSQNREGQQYPQNIQQVLPMLPTVIQFGTYLPPSHPFQNQVDYLQQNQLYKQQSAQVSQYQQRNANETDSKYATMPHKRTPSNTANQIINQNREVHLAFLFASPLMLETSEGNVFDCLPPIGFQEEFEEILNALEPQNINFRYRYMVANDANLRECLNDNPIGLHFSGHGFVNNDNLFKNDKKAALQCRNKGDILLFETNYGSSTFYTETDLKEVLEVTYGRLQLEFVFVSSCHSECVGKIFQSAGAKHVICIDQKYMLQDEAAINFARTFYCHVFAGNNSICDAFESARTHIKKTLGKLEADKYKLLLSQDHKKTCSKNDIRRNITPGIVQYKGVMPQILKLPTKVSPFISRNQDMLDVIRYLNDTNLLQVFGLPGLGKSSLIKNVANFIGERNLYRDGVLYINFQNNKTFQEALVNIMQNFEGNYNPNTHMKHLQLNFNNSFRKQEKQKLLRQVYREFARFKKSFLLVLDNLDDIGRDYQNELSQLMMNIVQESANSIKILFSSSLYYEHLENYKIKKLRGLNRTDSLEMFLSKIPLQDDELQTFLNWDKIMEIHDFTVKHLGESNINIKLCKHKNHTFKCVKDYLVQHPLFEILGGQPLSLAMIAPLSLKFSLREIYQQLVESPILEVFKGRIKEDALILSLEVCLKILNDTQDGKAVELFYLIGITKEGLFEDDLDQLFEEEDTQKKLQSLVELSLIQYETIDKVSTQKRFRVSTFLDKYVDQKLQQASKRDLNMFISTYYTNKLIKIKKDYVNSGDKKVLREGLLKYEKNIQYCLKQLFNIDCGPQEKQLFGGSGIKSAQNSPRATPKISQQLVDKNMIEVGNATMKFTQQNQLSVPGGESARIRKVARNQISTIDVGGLVPMSEEFKDDDILSDRKRSDASGYSIERTSRENSVLLKNNGEFSANKKDFQIRQSSYGLRKIINPAGKPTLQNNLANQNFTNQAQAINIKNHNISQGFTTSENESSSKNSPDNNIQLRQLKLKKENSKVSNNERRLYDRQLNKLRKLGKQNINKGRFDQLVKSLTLRMGNSQTDEFEKLFKKGVLNFQQPLSEQLAQLTQYEQLCYHYISILGLLEERQNEVGQLIFQNDIPFDANELVIPQQNKLLLANLRMVYIYCLIQQNRYDAVTGENLELYSLFQDVNCPQGQGISLYLKAKYLQKMKRKSAYAKAEKYILKSATKFEQALEIDGIDECIQLLKKVNEDHPQIEVLQQKMEELIKNHKDEIQEKQNEQINLNKILARDKSQDKVKNMLMNVIPYSYLQKDKKNSSPNFQMVKEQAINSHIQQQQKNSPIIRINMNHDQVNSPLILGSNGKPTRGFNQTPQIISKKAIQLANQPKIAFEQDQDIE